MHVTNGVEEEGSILMALVEGSGRLPAVEEGYRRLSEDYLIIMTRMALVEGSGRLPAVEEGSWRLPEGYRRLTEIT